MDIRALLKSVVGLSDLNAPPKRKNLPARVRKEEQAKKSRRKMQRASRRANR